MASPPPFYRPTGWSPPPRRTPWRIWAVGLAFVGVAALFVLYFLFSATYSPGYGPRYAFGGAFLFLFILFLLLFVVRVVFWSARAARYGGGYGPRRGYGPGRPAMVARMRYARGEITREQYDQIMEGLERRPPLPP